MVSIKKLIPLFTSLLLFSFNATGQYSLSGKIIDAESGEGLSYVNITFKDYKGHSTTSDQHGHFSIGDLNLPSYRVMFSMIGFQTIHLDSITAASDPIRVEMHPEMYLANEVVVSASRKSQSLNLAPASVGMVNRADIEETGVRSFDDTFYGINGVVATRSSGSNVQAFSIRGSSEVAGGGIGNRVLLLLDGRPAITPESGGALWNLVPLGAVERIEVIKGAYSSLFGSSAMGGIVNVITRKPEATSNTSLNLHYGFYGKAPAYTEYDQYNAFYGLDYTTSRKLGRFSYLFNLAGKTNDGNRENTAFDLYNGYAKLKYDFSPNRSMQISAMYSDIFNDTPATWLSTRYAYSVADYRKDDTQHRKEWNGDLYYEAYAHSDLKYSTRFYYYNAHSDYVFNGDPENDSTNINQGKQFIDSEEVMVHRVGNTTQIDLSKGDVHYLIGGIEVQGDYVNGQPDTVLYGEHTAWNLAAFVQDQMTLSDKLILTAGIRYDYYQIKGTYMEGNINPKIAAVYQLNKKFSLRGLLARAFRNPSIAERYTKFEQGGGLSFTTSPYLRAEKLIISAEVGTKINLNKVKFDIALYYNHYKDLISYLQRSAPNEPLLFEVINLSKAIMKGFEISGAYSPIEEITLRAGYTYLDAQDASEERINDALPYRSKHTTYATLLANHGKFQLFFQMRSRSRIDEVFIYPGSEPGGYVLFNTKVDYAVSENFLVFIKLDNLTDVQYEEIERYRMPGRTYSVGLNLNF